jgi:hypothetical protein
LEWVHAISAILSLDWVLIDKAHQKLRQKLKSRRRSFSSRCLCPDVDGSPEIDINVRSISHRVNELEKQLPDASKIEALKASAPVLTRQIDDIPGPSPNELTHLLAK